MQHNCSKHPAGLATGSGTSGAAKQARIWTGVPDRQRGCASAQQPVSVGVLVNMESVMCCTRDLLPVPVQEEKGMYVAG